MKYEQTNHKIKKIFEKSNNIKQKLNIVKSINPISVSKNIFKNFYIYETEWINMNNFSNYTNYEIILPNNISDILLSTLDVKLIYKTTNGYTEALQEYIANDYDREYEYNYFSYLIRKKDDERYYVIINSQVFFYDDSFNTLPIELKFILTIYNPNTYYEIRRNKS